MEGTVQMTTDQLTATWNKVGAQINEVAGEFFQGLNHVQIEDRTYIGFVNAVLDRIPGVSKVEVDAPSFGYLIYLQTGSSVIESVANIMPGDIITLHDAMLNEGASHASTDEGITVAGIVGEYEPGKSMVKVYQASEHGSQHTMIRVSISYVELRIHDPHALLKTVKYVTYELRDLQSGFVKVYRVLEKAKVPRDSVVDGDYTDVPPSVLPLGPTVTNTSSQGETINGVLDLTGQVVSVSLFGSVGIGKSFVARTILQHDRTKMKFGEHRHSMRCDLITSLEGFLIYLSDVIHTDVELLRPHLRSSPPLILVLDGVDSIVDPPTPRSRDISAIIEEFGSYEHVCIVTTSTVLPKLDSFHKVEVSPLSEDTARDMFYARCDLARSSAVDRLIASLDFHPLSIELLSSHVRQNCWDEMTFVQAWDNDQMGVLKTCYDQRLEDAIEPTLQSLKELGTVAWDVLETIAASPGGIEACELEGRVTNAGEVVNVLWKFSLVRHQGEFVKMIFPIRSYFLELMSKSSRTEGFSRCEIDCIPGACMSSYFPIHFAHVV